MTPTKQNFYIPLTVRIESGEEDEGGYVALCDELGVASQGESIEEALASIREAITEFVAGLDELGDLGTFLTQRSIRLLDEVPSKSTVDVIPGELVSTVFASVRRDPTPV